MLPSSTEAEQKYEEAAAAAVEACAEDTVGQTCYICMDGAAEEGAPLCDTRSYVYGVRCSCAGLNSRCTPRMIFFSRAGVIVAVPRTLFSFSLPAAFDAGLLGSVL